MSDEKLSELGKLRLWLENKKWIAIFLLVVAAVIGLGALVESLDKIRDFISKSAPEEVKPKPGGLGGEDTPSGTAVPPDQSELVPGLTMDVWRMRGARLESIPDAISLGSAIVTENFFQYGSFANQPEFSVYFGEALGIQWSGYLKVSSDAVHSFECEFRYPKLELYSFYEAHVRADVADQTIFTGSVNFREGNTGHLGKTHNDYGLKTGNKSVMLGQGYHEFRVWIAASDVDRASAVRAGRGRGSTGESAEPVKYTESMRAPESIVFVIKIRRPGDDVAQTMTDSGTVCYTVGADSL
jgi:hypothetical protein